MRFVSPFAAGPRIFISQPGMTSNVTLTVSPCLPRFTFVTCPIGRPIGSLGLLFMRTV